MVGLIMNLIIRTYHSCEKRKYAFMILRKYTIISQTDEAIDKVHCYKNSSSLFLGQNGKLILIFKYYN